jgi:hypothetical protein
MAYFAPYLVGGLAAILTMDYLPPVTKAVGAAMPATFWAEAAPAVRAEPSRKGDRLATAQVTESRPEIAAVEVVGLRSAAIVYRDREGRELFRTDSASNITTVSKGVTLPEVTIRRHAGSTVRPVPVEIRDQAQQERNEQDGDRTRTSKPQRAKVPMGCEPSFSPVAQPQLAHHTGRCMAAAPAWTQVAELVR